MTTQARHETAPPSRLTKNGTWEEYPSHGDPPLTDTELQRIEREALYAVLADHFGGRNDLYVGADMFVYYEEGNRNKKVSPDLFVCFGVPRRMRRVYKTWEDAHGLDWVLEVVSSGTWRNDLGHKRKLYAARMGVKEYFVYDPEGDYLKRPLMGFRRQGTALEPFSPEPSGRFRSELLGLELGLTAVRRDLGRWELGFHAPDGTRLLRPAEALAQERRALERERQARAEAEAELVRLRAEVARLQRPRDPQS
jgi:Uma2 family endonuclease